MREHFPEVRKGDRPLARDENQIRRALESLDAEGPPFGQQMVDLAGVKATAQPRVGFTMVRITAIIVPESSSLYEASFDYRDGGSNAFNAVLQVWDDNAKAWSDDPSADGVDVALLDDGQGWRPLTVGDIIPCMWQRSAARYVPFHSREVAIVVPSGGGPDSDGMYAGQRVVFDSDAKSWVAIEDVYLLDVG